MSKMIETSIWPPFVSQWGVNDLYQGQVFEEPSLTIPDQTMTIPEIIAKFTRTGLVPASVKLNDKGGNMAADPESDPLDDYSAAQAAAAAAKAAADSSKPAPSGSGESGDSAPAPAGA